jgi:hypothetical protein
MKEFEGEKLRREILMSLGLEFGVLVGWNRLRRIR